MGSNSEERERKREGGEEAPAPLILFAPAVLPSGVSCLVTGLAPDGLRLEPNALPSPDPIRNPLETCFFTLGKGPSHCINSHPSSGQQILSQYAFYKGKEIIPVSNRERSGFVHESL